MDRRGFFSRLAVVAAGFSILPSATTYDRIWKPTPKPEMFFNPRDFMGKWKFVSFGFERNSGTLFVPEHTRLDICTTMDPDDSL